MSPAPKGNKFAKDSKTNGAKTKLTEELIKAMTTVVSENILYATDEDLIELVNELLPEESQFGIDIFGKWKRGESQAANPLHKDFLRLIKRSLFTQKKRLLKLMEDDPQQWQRYAWILERKFDEWNIKFKTELSGKDGKDLFPKTLTPEERNAEIEALRKELNV